MAIQMPTKVKADPAILEKYQGRAYPSLAPLQMPCGQTVLHMKTDRAGLMALLARDGDCSIGIGSYEKPGWYGVSSVSEALTLAENGWDEPVEAIIEQANQMIARKTRSLIPILTYTDTPGEPDIAAYLEGEDECFLITSEGMFDTPAAGRAVRIVFAPVVSAGISTDAIIRRGALVASVAHTLEQAGVSVAIEYRSALAPYSRGNVHIEVILKEFGEPLDIRNLAFWLVHPAAGRVFMFSACTDGYYFSRHEQGIGWSSVDWPNEPNVAFLPRHTTFEYGGDLEQWASAALKIAGIEIGG